jgi:hypothetical protein
MRATRGHQAFVLEIGLLACPRGLEQPLATIHLHIEGRADWIAAVRRVA